MQLGPEPGSRSESEAAFRFACEISHDRQAEVAIRRSLFDVDAVLKPTPLSRIVRLTSVGVSDIATWSLVVLACRTTFRVASWVTR